MTKLGNPPKLTISQVARIRRVAKHRKQLTNKALAKRYGVSQTTIAKAASGSYSKTQDAMRDIRGRA